MICYFEKNRNIFTISNDPIINEKRIWTNVHRWTTIIRQNLYYNFPCAFYLGLKMPIKMAILIISVTTTQLHDNFKLPYYALLFENSDFVAVLNY